MPDFNEFADEAKKLASEHPDQADSALNKAGQFADQETGNRFDSQIQQGEQAGQNYLHGQGQGQQGGQYGDQNQGGQYGDQNQGGQYGDQNQGGQYGDQNQGGQYGDQNQGGQYGDQNQGGQYGDQNQGGTTTRYTATRTRAASTNHAERSPAIRYRLTGRVPPRRGPFLAPVLAPAPCRSRLSPGTRRHRYGGRDKARTRQWAPR